MTERTDSLKDRGKGNQKGKCIMNTRDIHYEGQMCVCGVHSVSLLGGDDEKGTLDLEVQPPLTHASDAFSGGSCVCVSSLTSSGDGEQGRRQTA